MADYVSILVLELAVENGPTFDLSDLAQSADYTVTKSKSRVHTLNAERRARGLTSGPEEVEGSITIAVPAGSLAADFYAMQKNNTRFALRCRRIGSGTRVIFDKCEISEISESSEATSEEALQMEISWMGIESRNVN